MLAQVLHPKLGENITFQYTKEDENRVNGFVMINKLFGA